MHPARDPPGVVVIGVGDYESIQNVLKCRFDVNDKNKIALSNRYFAIEVPVTVHYEEELPHKFESMEFTSVLANSPAQAVVVIGSNVNATENGKQLWEKIYNYCQDSAVSFMYIEEAELGEEQLSDLIRWGLKHRVEIITEDICEEEGITIAHRVKQALECAQWHLGIEESQHGSESKTIATPSNNASGEETVADPAADVSKPTRLRRGLQKKDILSIEQDLLLLSNSEED